MRPDIYRHPLQDFTKLTLDDLEAMCTGPVRQELLRRHRKLEAKYAALVAAARPVLELASLSVPKMRICDTPDNAFESMCALRALLPGCER
jgi:hypothetical protein